MRGFGGSNQDLGYGIAVDGSGNSYVTGSFIGPVTLGAGEPNETVLSGSISFFIAKYDSSGQLVWAKQAAPTAQTRGYDITVDRAGNSYATGTYHGVITLGLGEPNETTLSTGFADAFVAKFARNGELRWAKAISGPGSFDNGWGIGIDDTGNIYVSGEFVQSVRLGIGEANETTMFSEGLQDLFMAKYGPNGQLSWARSAGGPESDRGLGSRWTGMAMPIALGTSRTMLHLGLANPVRRF